MNSAIAAIILKQKLENARLKSSVPLTTLKNLVVVGKEKSNALYLFIFSF